MYFLRRQQCMVKWRFSPASLHATVWNIKRAVGGRDSCESVSDKNGRQISSQCDFPVGLSDMSKR